MTTDNGAFGEALDILTNGGTLGCERSRSLIGAILSDELCDAQIGAVLALLRLHTPTPDELTGAAQAMRDKVTPVPFARPEGSILIDTCGTGGAPKTFNVSTTAAIVLAGVTPPPESGFDRVLVAKHGNRSRTGRGSAEVLESLGVHLGADPEVQAACLGSCGVCFCFAVNHHGAIKHAMPARRALGVATIFNALGPLTNPVGADAQLIGVYDDALVEPVARALVGLGATRGMVVHSEDGLDELSITAPSRCVRIRGAELSEERVDPEALGLEIVPIDRIRARDVAHSAEIVRSVLAGTRDPFFSMTMLTVGGALWGAGVCGSIREGIELGTDSVDSGRARAALDALVRVSNGS